MKTSIIVAAIVIIVVAAGLGIYFSGVLNPTPTTIRVGELQGDLHHLALAVAINNGYFIANGLNVTTTQYINGPTLMQHFLAGELDFAYVGVPPAMTARANAMALGNITDLPVVVAGANLEGSAITVNPNVIPNIQALNGKTIGTPGVGTIQDILLSIFDEDNNITLTKYPTTNANLPLVFSKGDIQGLISWEPTPAITIYNSNASTLVTSHDMFPDHQCCVLIVNQNFLNAHPDIVARMVSAHEQASKFINDNPDAAKLIAANFTHLSAPIINLAFPLVNYSYIVNVPSVQTFLNDMIDLGVIKTLNHTQVDSFLAGFINTQYITP